MGRWVFPSGELSRPSHAAGPLSFGQVEPRLFEIVASGGIATRWTPEEAR